MLFSESRRRDIFEGALIATNSTKFVEGGRYYIDIAKDKVNGENFLQLIHEAPPVIVQGWDIQMGEKKSDDPINYKVYFVTHKKENK